ncbi:hypothetical protein M011DRAFT_461991 [Sporormia fimetaria CBS 119925]|uniref:F-box domain-containing protein n=1 Tax=Sporormia fimetaria CBS 119925 TaxID=1340428 RepID=A0A6A6UZW7_9PLEO|nr:hypothetical protein M011DRAFT_461991 [Sporormia fimetaria CBS 119925]
MSILSILESLAVELQQQIASNLDINDVLSLRHASRTLECTSQRRFVQLINPRLRQISVCNSDDGLRLLRGLCRIPGCLPQITKISVISLRQFTVLVDNIAGRVPPMVEFETSNACARLWTEICGMLKALMTFRTLYLGHPIDCRTIDSALGAREVVHVMKLMGLNGRWIPGHLSHGNWASGRYTPPQLSLYDHDGLHFRDLCSVMTGFLVAFKQAGFRDYNLTIQVRATRLPLHYENSSPMLPLVAWREWDSVVKAAIRHAEISNLDFTADPHDQNRTFELVSKYLSLATNAFRLHIDGHCNGRQHTSTIIQPGERSNECVALTRPLATQAFHNLSIFSLENTYVDASDLYNFLNRHSRKLKWLRLESVHVQNGSWIPVLAAMRKLTSLSELTLSGLSPSEWPAEVVEAAGRLCRRYVRGAQNIYIFLAVVLDYMVFMQDAGDRPYPHPAMLTGACDITMRTL